MDIVKCQNCGCEHEIRVELFKEYKELEADLKKAEDILKVMLNAKGNIKMLHSALVATEDYFKDR